MEVTIQSVIDLILKILVSFFSLVSMLIKLSIECFKISFLIIFFSFFLISEENEELIYVKFFKFYRCYDLIPISAKLVVFDTQLLVKKAFFALVGNGKFIIS